MALRQLLSDINSQKTVMFENTSNLLMNIASFMNFVPTDVSSSVWASVFVEFEEFFNKLLETMKTTPDLTAILKIMKRLLQVPYIVSAKTILEPFSKLLSHVLRNSDFMLEEILELCSLSNKLFVKDRGRFYLPRAVVTTLFDFMNCRTLCKERNVLLMIQFVLIDLGGVIYPSPAIADDVSCLCTQPGLVTNGAEYMRTYLNDIITFIADIHTVSRLKTFVKDKAPDTINLSEDTLGGQMKSGLAQYLALEFSTSKENKIVSRILPWLYNPPTSLQQSTKDFAECIDHIRLLSWLLIGSLTHSAITQNETSVVSQPIPIDASCSISDHVMYILTGFAEQSKNSVIHMSSLFHSVILCQLWTMYCEQFQTDSQSLEAIMEFWTRITPGILQLLSHSKVLAEMVNLHFLSLVEALQESNSVVLAKLFPLWEPVLYTHTAQLPAHTLVRLQACLNYQPSIEAHSTSMFRYTVLLKWLQRLQFKIVQIESQSSHAAQFYTL